ncbi:MAG: PAS domain-containing sensor histidine kinase [Candidatus Aminicenantales bacterium]
MFSRRSTPLFILFLFCFFSSFISLVLYLLIPVFTSADYYQKSLNLLKKQSRAVKNEFARVLDTIEDREKIFLTSELPQDKPQIFALLKSIELNPETEGLAYFSEKGNLELWRGKVLDLKMSLDEEDVFTIFSRQNASSLIKHKASVFLVSPLFINDNGFIAFFRLLAFSPQFKTRHLKEYQFLKPRLSKNLQNIRYYDFKEDVSVFERFFRKHGDEYIGQPSLQNEIQTIFFPLRNRAGRIVAVADLSSPSLSSSISARKESMFFLFHLFFGISLIILLLYLVKTSSYIKTHRILLLSLIGLTLVFLRIILLSLSQLEKIKTLDIFSPSLASFLPFTGLTKSPADIFFTFSLLFLIILCFFLGLKYYLKEKKSGFPFVYSLFLNAALISISIFLFIAFEKILRLLIFNSSLNLLRFNFTLPAILLHLSVISLASSYFLLVYLLFRISYRFTSQFSLPLVLIFLASACLPAFFREKPLLLFALIQFVVTISLLFLAYNHSLLRKKFIPVTAFILASLVVYISLNHYLSLKLRFVIESSLKNTVTSQKEWGKFIAQQTLNELEEKASLITSYLRSPELPDFAQSLWKETLLSRFNWYSSLEIWDSRGETMSRFSLNVPRLYPLALSQSSSQEWLTSYQTIPFLGEDKNLLVSFKDWFENDEYLGRTILTLSLDYDMLPFLYSAHPYFELIRVTTLPSLHELNFGFAVYDTEGKLLFNPNKISRGIEPHLLERINSSQAGLWSFFQDKGEKYNSYYFSSDNRVYAFFYPRKNIMNFSSEFLRLIFLYTAFFLLSLLATVIILEKKRIKNPFWSFSSRVYASFIAVAIIPLLFFTFFTRSFFQRIFSQQFIQQAEVHANFAYRIMEDFTLMQEEEQLTPVAPPEDLVLWISSAISNDVNFYQDGRLISSSRREFFDAGLLPDLIDGEIYYKIQFENNPFYTQKQKIGDYAFHTLTIPFRYLNSLFLISLPFPFEQQEIANASEEFIEFLVFISIFFVGLVLVFARGIGGMIISPINKLLRGTKEVGLGNLKVKIEHKPRDEMKTLIDGFNSMIKNLRRHQQELTDLSKKVAWAEMARRVAHEIKNPLTPIQLSAEHLLKVHSDKKGDLDKTIQESASYIIKEVEHLRKIAQEFLDISREKSLEKKLFDLKELVRETILPFKQTLPERVTFIENYRGDDFHYRGDKGKIKIALRNILINAIEAIRKHGEIQIRLEKAKDSFLLEVRDTGIGMEKEMQKRIFEPSFSTKDVGTGLGLPIARKIIEDHGGTIKLTSELGKGTKIMIKLPIAPDINP